MQGYSLIPIEAFQAAKVRVTVDGPAGIEIVYLYCAPDVIHARRIVLHLPSESGPNLKQSA